MWQPLADHLDVHAVAEEEIFYPQLLRRGGDDAEDETLDAIGDHNDIRDGVHAAARHPIGTDAWWDAVQQARDANDEHMAEEENEGLPDFRLHAAPACATRWAGSSGRSSSATATHAGSTSATRTPPPTSNRSRIAIGSAPETPTRPHGSTARSASAA
ncbi:hemerythrin domain-containing protein [Pseudonocardia benzenivorans]